MPIVRITAGKGKLVKMNLIKSSSVYYFGICIFLLAVVFLAGCIGTQRTTTDMKSSVVAIAQTSVTSTTLGSVSPTLTPTQNKCSIPTLVFNNSQEKTKLGNDVGIIGLKITGFGDKPSSEPGTVPLGGIIYHDAGFTRIFDSTGNQILYINDSESFALTPGGGPQPATSVYSVPTLAQIVYDGDNVTNIYQKGNSTCIAIVITAPSSRVKVISK